MTIHVREEYTSLVPKRALAPYVEDILSTVPPHYLSGLEFVLVTDSETNALANGRKTQSRGKIVARREAESYYAYANGDAPAFIVLHVDRIGGGRKDKANTTTGPVRRFLCRKLIRPTCCRFRLAMPLYSEIGYHVRATQEPEVDAKDDFPEQYSVACLKRFAIRRWYIIAIAVVSMICLFPLRTWKILRTVGKD